MRLPDRRRPAPLAQDTSEPRTASPSPGSAAPPAPHRARLLQAGADHPPAPGAEAALAPAPDCAVPAGLAATDATHLATVEPGRLAAATHDHPAPASGAADERALRQELTALLPEMRGFARFLARDRSQADDLVQDTVVRALAALPQFQPGSNLKAWVLTIERNAFYEQARRFRREQSALRQRFADETHERPAQDARDHLSDLQRLLFALPPLQREALVLVGAQELSHEAAAAICGVPVGTMKARVSRGRARLAAIMERRASLAAPEAPDDARSPVPTESGDAAAKDDPP